MSGDMIVKLTDRSPPAMFSAAPAAGRPAARARLLYATPSPSAPAASTTE